MTVDTNVRSLRREGELFTIHPRSTTRRFLCGKCCALKSCGILKDLRKKCEGVVVELMGCKHYEAPINFADATGLEYSRFNTLRLGRAWSERIRKGDIVGIIGPDRKILKRMKVTKVICGPKEQIVTEHARFNHLYRSGEHENPGEHLLNRMPSLYGNLIWKNNGLCTAIYLCDLK